MRICKICFKEINEPTLHNFLFRDVTICHDCFIKLAPVIQTFKFCGVECLHIYFYNEKIQELLYQFKGCKDYELKTIFLEYYKHYLNLKFKGYTIIPAPSFSKNDEERGFNHVEEIFKSLNLKILKIVHKIKQVKQADLTSEERAKIGEALVIDNVNLSRKKILIVDDVFTTGSTVKSMINLVRKNGAKKIKVLLMSKTIDIDKRWVWKNR